MNVLHLTCAALLVVLSGAASAQPVVDVDEARSVVKVGRDQQGYSSCGTVTQLLPGPNAAVMGAIRHEFSIELMASGAAGVTAGSSIVDPVSGKATPGAEPPTRFWLAEAAGGERLMPADLFNSIEARSIVLALVPFPDAMRTLRALASGARMHVVIRYKSEQADGVVAFAAPLPEPEARTLAVCIDGLLPRVRPFGGQRAQQLETN